MARIRVGLVIGPNGVQAAVPTGLMVPGSWRPLVPNKVTADGLLPGVQVGDPELTNVTVEVDVPAEDTNAAGTALDPVKLKARYPGHFLEGRVWPRNGR